METGQAARNQAEDLRCDIESAEIEIFGAEGVGDCLVEPMVVNKPAIDHGLRDGLAVERNFIENIVCLRRLQDMLLDEKLGNLFIVHGSMGR